MPIRRITAAAITTLVLGAVAFAAPAAAAKTTTVKVELHDSGCPKKITTKAGKIRFEIENVDASAVTEFEVLKGDGILGEKENLSPGLSGEFTLTLKAGTYTTYCPGGDRERGKLVVKGATDLEASTVGTCVPVGDISSATSKTNVTLDEWVIDFESAEIASGSVGIQAHNAGTQPHEIVVLQGVAADALPVDKHGALDEKKLPQGALIGEIEPFAKSTDCSGVFPLPPGEYVAVCNITNTSKGKKPVSHLAKGMLTTFTVT